MTFLRILVEGDSDVRVVRQILQRRFRLREGEHFLLHPHQGKGRRPRNPLAAPDPKNRGLLDQLPALLRAFAKEAIHFDLAVVVLVDADREDCRELKEYLLTLQPRPGKTLFRIAVEEIESWFLADKEAIKASFPRAQMGKVPAGPPDQVIGAWETLARVLGREPNLVTGRDKASWAESISPRLDLEEPGSPSLRVFLSGLQSLLQRQ